MRAWLILGLVPTLAYAQAPVLNGSGSVTTGGTSQIVFPANANRVFLRCQNPTATLSGVTAESLFVNYDVAASTTAATSEEIVNGGSTNFSGDFVPKGTVSVTAATTGHKFMCLSR